MISLSMLALAGLISGCVLACCLAAAVELAGNV